MMAMTHPPMGIMNRGGSLGMEMMGTPLLSPLHDSMMMQRGMMMGAGPLGIGMMGAQHR
jgi:hypothetical protein